MRLRREGRAACYVMAATGLAMTCGSRVSAQGAQSLDQANIVLSRARPGLDAEGLRLGSLRLLPSLESGIAYDDNLYNTRADRVRSAVFTAVPTLILSSDWRRNQLTFNANLRHERYLSRSTENNTQYHVDGAGRIDVGALHRIDITGHYLSTIEARGTPGDIFSQGKPIRYSDTGGSGGVLLQFTSLLLSVSGNYSRVTYRDAKIGQTRISQAYRNRDAYGGTTSVGLMVSPSLQPFAQFSLSRERYDNRAREGSLDSKTYTVLGGLRIPATHLITGSIGVGYLKRIYRNPAFSSSSGLGYEAALVWNPRTLVAVTLQARKSIGESPTGGSSGFISDDVGASIDYEFLRRLLFRFDGSFTREKYREIDRIDHRVSGGVTTRYLVNRFAELRLRYQHRRQFGSGGASREYSGNAILLSLWLQR